MVANAMQIATIRIDISFGILTADRSPLRCTAGRPRNDGASDMVTSASEDAPESVFVVSAGAMVGTEGSPPSLACSFDVKVA